MSNFGVYNDEMPDGTLLAEDIELLLTGGIPNDEAVARLVPLVATERARYSFLPSHGETVRFGIDLARVAEETRPAPAEEISRSGRSRRTLRRRLAPVLVSAVMLAAMTGVAYAADDSAPGDALYGLDRALEAIGIGNGGAAERIAEAQALFADGKVAEAVAHAAEAAQSSGDPATAMAADVLQKAAAQLRANENGSDRAVDVRNQVADLLDWMATTDAKGGEFGQGVAERAGELSANDPGSNAADAASKGSGNAADPQDAANPPEHPNKPADVGAATSGQGSDGSPSIKDSGNDSEGSQSGKAPESPPAEQAGKGGGAAPDKSGGRP